ncbi:dTDP-4-dehydrorhamnose 3,5-epimerase [Nitrospira sp. Kam-Ns4a]
MKFIETALKGVILVEPDVHEDPRGFFMETYHAKKYAEGGIPGPFVQDNYSLSVRGTLRGLHYQLVNPQGKLVCVFEGAVFDVAVDIRQGSPTFGRWIGVELSATNKRQLYVPVGFAHGFCVLSDTAGMVYKCTDFYNPQGERGIIWNDPDIGIAWPITAPLLSAKDAGYKRLADMMGDLFEYRS